MRAFIGTAAVIVVFGAAGCTGKPGAPSAPSAPSAPAAPSPSARPPGTTSLDCSAPIDIRASPTAPYRDILGVVGLITTPTLQVSPTGGSDPHRLFAKTGLLVHAGREATLTVPPDWAARVSLTWGNHAPEWTASLYIPACPDPSPGSDRWLVFPGGFSLDKAACVPLEVRAGNETTTVHVPVGAPCPG